MKKILLLVLLAVALFTLVMIGLMHRPGSHASDQEVNKLLTEHAPPWVHRPTVDTNGEQRR